MVTSAGDTSVWVALIDALGPLLTAAVVALVTWKIAVWRTRESVRIGKESDMEIRIWDLRRVGYSVVVAKLGEASEYAARLDDGYNGPGANPHGFDTSDRCQEQMQKMWGAWAECKSEFGKNRLTCSEAFASRFRKIDDSLWEINLVGDDPPGIASSVAKCFKAAHSDLLSMALEELALKSEEKGLATKPARE